MKPIACYIYAFFDVYEYLATIIDEDVVYFMSSEECYQDSEDIGFYIKQPEAFKSDIFFI